MWNKVSERIKQTRPSAIRKYFSVPEDVITLGIGEPDFDSPKAVVDTAIRSLQNGKTHYTANSGMPELCSAVTEYLNKLYGLNYDPADEIIITVGASEALFLAFGTILNPGDEVIVLTPCFGAYQASVSLMSGVPVEVPCRFEDDFDVDPAAIEAAVTPKTKAILLGFPNNPTGAVASREKLQQVCDIAKKYDLTIVSDEIYDRLVYGWKHVSFPALDGARERTILVSGLSKSHAMTGFRLGFIVAPREIIEGAYRIHQYLIMSAPTIAQCGAITAVRDCEEDVARMVAEYDRRRKLVVNTCNEIGLTTFEPKGAFYAFPCIKSTGLDSTSFAERLIKDYKVAVIPGCGFGAGGEGHVRISYATSYEKIEKALERIAKMVKAI